ncbi:MAG: hypothetical protein GY928_08495 [Colwellia sp.]|nr:hypothetical protein [Colwellia sp.]
MPYTHQINFSDCTKAIEFNKHTFIRDFDPILIMQWVEGIKVREGLLTNKAYRKFSDNELDNVLENYTIVESNADLSVIDNIAIGDIVIMDCQSHNALGVIKGYTNATSNGFFNYEKIPKHRYSQPGHTSHIEKLYNIAYKKGVVQDSQQDLLIAQCINKCR